jgi:tetratricopeptide (TPR) repeat protein
MKIPDSLPPDSRLLGLAPDAIRAVVAAAHTLDLGRVDEAERQIRALLAPYPDHPEVLRLLAGLQSLRGDATAALNTMHRAVSARPNDALYLNTVGTIQLNAGDYDGAIATLRHACGIDPNMAVAWYNLGLALVRSVRPIEAATALRRALALSPDKFNARVMLADMLKAANQIGAAQTEYRRVLAQKSDAGMAWWGLADIKTLKLDETDVAAIELALRKPDASDDDVIAMGFALAKALDDQGRYAQSLDALAAANARARARRHWNAAQFSDGIDKVLSIFTPPPAGAPQALGQEVIFIASLPRSGSTLIEQILASHSQIEGAGELPDLPLVLSEESQRRRQFFPHWVPSMQPEDWARLGRRYLERTAHWRAQRPRFTDKLPSNWMYVGAIRWRPVCRATASIWPTTSTRATLTIWRRTGETSIAARATGANCTRHGCSRITSKRSSPTRKYVFANCSLFAICRSSQPVWNSTRPNATCTRPAPRRCASRYAAIPHALSATVPCSIRCVQRSVLRRSPPRPLFDLSAETNPWAISFGSPPIRNPAIPGCAPSSPI